MTWKDLKRELSYYLGLPYKKYKDLYYYCMNRWIWHGHMLRTDIAPGQYSDKVYLIPSALFCAVEDYIGRDGEDAFGTVCWETEDDIRVRETIIDILHFWHIELPELQRLHDEALKEWFMACPLVFHRDNRGSFLPDTSGRGKKWNDKARFYEKKMSDKTKRYAKMVVDIHEYLWT
jgi:hypothetical protein